MLFVGKHSAVFGLIIEVNIWSKDQKENEEMSNNVLNCWVTMFR